MDAVTDEDAPDRFGWDASTCLRNVYGAVSAQLPMSRRRPATFAPVTAPRPTPNPAWFLALHACMVSGLVLAVGVFVTWPLLAIWVALAMFIGGLGTTGAFAFHDHRVSGHGFWAGLGHGSKTFLRGLWELFP
jgi:hypothetical protein